MSQPLLLNILALMMISMHVRFSSAHYSFDNATSVGDFGIPESYENLKLKLEG
jgi:hypothetical protein